MASRKLTLSVDEGAIEKARRYSSRHNTSISRLVSQFLASLPEGERRYGPTVERLTGVLPADIDAAAYHRHLEAKHGA